MNINNIKNIIFEELLCNLNETYTPNFLLVEDVYAFLLSESVFNGEPLTPNELRNILRKKIVNFEFVKLNGEDRLATGTLRMDIIPKKDHPKGIRPSNKEKVVTYFDLDKMQWRSVSTRTKEIALIPKEYTGEEDENEVDIIVKDIPKDNETIIKDTEKDEDDVILTNTEVPDKGEAEKETRIEKDIEEPIEKPTQEPSQQSQPNVEEPIEEPIEEPQPNVEEPVKEPETNIEEPVKEPSEQIKNQENDKNNTEGNINNPIKGASISKMLNGGNSVKFNNKININKKNNFANKSNSANINKETGRVEFANTINNKKIYNNNGKTQVKLPGIININNKNKNI